MVWYVMPGGLISCNIQTYTWVECIHWTLLTTNLLRSAAHYARVMTVLILVVVVLVVCLLYQVAVVLSHPVIISSVHGSPQALLTSLNHHQLQLRSVRSARVGVYVGVYQPLTTTTCWWVFLLVISLPVTPQLLQILLKYHIKYLMLSQLSSTLWSGLRCSCSSCNM